MNRILLIFFLIILVSCKTEQKDVLKPVIAVSVLPQKYLVSSIADTLVDVVVMVPPGASPATWEASPAQMKSLEEAVLYFRIGHIGFEQAWMQRMEEINPEMLVVDLSKGLKLRGISVKHGDHSHQGVDPHTWMSPVNMDIMAAEIYAELIKIFPQYQQQLQQNYKELLIEIEKTGIYADNELSDFQGQHFLIFHPSLGYFADDFGLLQESIEYEGKEPSAAHLKKIIDMAKEKGIKTIFVQQEFDKRNAEIIAREINGEVVVINPLSETWPEEIKLISLSLKNSFSK